MRGKAELGDLARLKHLRDAILDIEQFTKGIAYEEYVSNLMMRLALQKLIEIIGEAANHITEATKTAYPSVEWRILTDTRNFIVHAYFGINYKDLWDAIQQDIPPLKEKILAVITNFE